MKKLIFIFLLLGSILQAQTTYYVSGGTALSTIAQVNALSLMPDDSVLFHAGETWKEILVPKDNGTSGHNIVFSSYGTGAKPIITGRDELPGWDVEGNWTQDGDKWYMSYAPTFTPARLWLNGVEKEKVFTTSVTSARPWYWASDVLYVYSATNPAITFTSIMTDQIRDNCIYPTAIPTGVQYITFSNLDLQYSHCSIRLESSSNIIVDNCNLSGYYGMMVTGYLTTDPFGDPSNNGVIKNCLFDAICTMTGATQAPDYTQDGLQFYKNIDNWDVYNNTFKNYGHTALYLLNPSDASYTMSNITVHNNYFTTPDADYGRAFGADYINGSGNKFYSNLCYNMATTIQINGQGFEFYNNIINIVRVSPWGATAGGLGISGYSALTTPQNMKIYNNVFANCYEYGIKINGTVGWANKQDNEFVNNIIYNCNDVNGYQIVIVDDATILDNIWRNNLLYKQGITDLVYYGHDTSDDYAHTVTEFNAENGTASDVINGNITGNPLFVSATDLHLSVGSPAIGMGVNVGLIYDYYKYLWLDPPSIGVYEYGSAYPKLARQGGKMIRIDGKITRQ